MRDKYIKNFPTPKAKAEIIKEKEERLNNQMEKQGRFQKGFSMTLPSFSSQSKLKVMNIN